MFPIFRIKFCVKKNPETHIAKWHSGMRMIVSIQYSIFGISTSFIWSKRVSMIRISNISGWKVSLLRCKPCCYVNLFLKTDTERYPDAIIYFADYIFSNAIENVYYSSKLEMALRTHTSIVSNFVSQKLERNI